MALLKTKTNKEKLLTVAFLEAIASLQVTFSLTHKLALVRIKYFMYGLWLKIQHKYT